MLATIIRVPYAAMDQLLVGEATNRGKLGDGSTTNRLTPVTVSGLEGATQIAASGFQSCALRSDQSVACWGQDLLGTGLGTTTPVTVPGLIGVIQVASGGDHVCALRSDGTVACWGRNRSGQLGDGTITDRLTPTTVPGLAAVTQIASGGEKSCALQTDGSVTCWGLSSYLSPLGDGHHGPFVPCFDTWPNWSYPSCR